MTITDEEISRLESAFEASEAAQDFLTPDEAAQFLGLSRGTLEFGGARGGTHYGA